MHLNTKINHTSPFNDNSKKTVQVKHLLAKSVFFYNDSVCVCVCVHTSIFVLLLDFMDIWVSIWVCKTIMTAFTDMNVRTTHTRKYVHLEKC